MLQGGVQDGGTRDVGDVSRRWYKVLKPIRTEGWKAVPGERMLLLKAQAEPHVRDGAMEPEARGEGSCGVGPAETKEI